MANDFLKELKKINPYAEIIEDDTLSNINEFISTGSLLLNSIISGDFNKGIPAGRITTLGGLSGVGKSLIAASTAANAQKLGYDVIYFDSEFAGDKDFMERLGVDISKLIKIPIATLEEFKNQCFKIIDVYNEKYKDTKKIMIVMDSLGNLASEKELNDATEGKNASDMGQRSKVIRSTLRILADKVGKARIPVIIVNHTYANPINIYAGEIMSGGEGLVYCSHVIINFKKSKIKDDDKTVTGTLLKPTTTKNRIFPPFKTGEIFLDFEKGMDKYYGLLPLAEASGLVVKEGRKYKSSKTDKLFWEKDIYCEEFFGPLLNDLNIYLKDKGYSCISEEVLNEPRKD